MSPEASAIPILRDIDRFAALQIGDLHAIAPARQNIARRLLGGTVHDDDFMVFVVQLVESAQRIGQVICAIVRVDDDRHAWPIHASARSG